ncbi:NAD/FAD-utilizing enzyme [Thalassotalea crassostreae]|uniref:NAD/FAD-utilizing enzyme n=1 Tax=Thalassotalea crassostreae TaxID=1763536 RepID=UPI0008396D68|nr:NAD/FAD-utilizing enzyme [Thalassotalea crassostreae]
MVRHYYLSNDLKELVSVEQELLDNGFKRPQMHVLSDQDAEVQLNHLHEVESILKKDIVHSTEVGALVGVIAATLVLLTAYLLNWTNTAAGWMPFIFLAIVLLGFCTWEGGFIGIQRPNVEFERFQKTLNNGNHVFFVDTDPSQESTLERVINLHPALVVESTGEATPSWVIRGQEKYQSFMKMMP